MKAKNFAELNNAELASKLVELKQNLFNLRFKHATNQLDNPNELVVCRRDIARVQTIIRQRELGIAVAPTAAPATKGRRK
jgi:large subunit ribosomal protein L29